MAPTIEESDRALNELLFLQQMYDAGARGAFDVLAVQAYGLRSGPDDLRLASGDVNGDGRPDVLVSVSYATSPGYVAIFRNSSH